MHVVFPLLRIIQYITPFLFVQMNWGVVWFIKSNQWYCNVVRRVLVILNRVCVVCARGVSAGAIASRF
jgi:hypothetical protein